MSSTFDLLPMWPSGYSTRTPYAYVRSVAGVRASARARPPTKELFLIIPMHIINREIIPGRKKRRNKVKGQLKNRI